MPSTRRLFKIKTLSWSLYLLIILCFLPSSLSACSTAEQPNSSHISSTSPTVANGITPSKTPAPTPEPTAIPVLNEGWGSRHEESLDGTWEYIKVDSLDDTPPLHGWEPIEVPSQLEGTYYERAWYRRAFMVDRTWEGKRLSIHFGGIKYNSRIYINGVEVGGCFNGQEPFDVDITDAVVFGAENDILVGTHDWTGLFSSPVPLSPGLSHSDIRLPENRLLSPIATNAMFARYGIWDSVILSITEPVYIADLFIHTLVSESSLDIDISVTNGSVDDSQVTVSARIFPWLGGDRDAGNQWPLQGDPVLISEGEKLDVPPNQTETVKISFDDPPLALWTPFQPNLYILEISLGASEEDAERVRFGYREISIEGPDFFLNGEKIHLPAVTLFHHSAPDENEIREELLGARAMNMIAMRNYDDHFGIFYELADEIGMLMIHQAEFGNGELIYRFRDPIFWENYQQHLLSNVNRMKNHPSVIIWSISAEFYNEVFREDQAVVNQLASLAESVHEADSTRPVMFSGDGDPGGAADVIGYHYPNEPNVFPEQREWPATAYWANKPLVRPTDWVYEDSFTFWDSDVFKWERNKPVFIGEQLFLPGGDPGRLTLFVGDDAYIPFRDQYDPGIWYENPLYNAKTAAFEMQILANRIEGVSGFEMWGVYKSWNDGRLMLHEDNPFWVVNRDMNRPLAAFLADYDNHFFSGESVSRKIALFNDTMQPQQAVTFAWSLLSGEMVLSEGTESFSMPSGDIRERELSLTMPTVTERTEIVLQLQMRNEEAVVFEEDYTLFVFPNLESWEMPGKGTALYDPDASLSQVWWDEEGMIVLENLEDWDGRQILVLGKNATRELPLESLMALQEKVQQGGRVLAIEQDSSISAVLPVTFTGFGSSTAFLQTPSHPIMNTFEPDDFRWWRGDLLVSYVDPVRTGTAGMTHLVTSGSMKGLNSAPLIELKQGQGHWILSQLAVITKLDQEPVAPLMLQEMLTYLDNLPNSGGKILVSDPAGEIQANEVFLEVDWEIEDLNDQNLDPASTDLFILHKALDDVEKNLGAIDQYLADGGVVLLDQPEPELFEKLADHWNLDIEMYLYSGAAYLNGPNQWENAEHLLREDFLWLTETEPFNLMASAMASGAAESVFMPNQHISGWIPMGSLSGATGYYGSVPMWDDIVVFFSNDFYEWDLAVPVSESNEHMICIQARANYKGNLPPQIAIWMDEQLAGIVAIRSSNLEEYCVWVQDLQPGNQRLGIEYFNRHLDLVEVKDIEIHKIAIQPFENQTGIKMISNPTALLSVPIGEGELILNGIQWQHGGWRGQRLFAGLLTSFGAGWQPGNSPIVIEGEDMAVEANHPWYSRITDHAWLLNNATLTNEVTIPKGGNYKIVLSGKGQPLHGKYPVFQVYLDGIFQGQIEIDSRHWQFHGLDLPLKAGEYTLSLVFNNNDFDLELGYGREVWIDQVRIYQK